MDPRWPQDGQRCAKIGLIELQDGAKMAKLEPIWSQDGAKIAPRWPKRLSKSPKIALGGHLGTPRKTKSENAINP